MNLANKMNVFFDFLIKMNLRKANWRITIIYSNLSCLPCFTKHFCFAVSPPSYAKRSGDYCNVIPPIGSAFKIEDSKQFIRVNLSIILRVGSTWRQNLFEVRRLGWSYGDVSGLFQVNWSVILVRSFLNVIYLSLVFMSRLTLLYNNTFSSKHPTMYILPITNFPIEIPAILQFTSTSGQLKKNDAFGFIYLL